MTSIEPGRRIFRRSRTTLKWSTALALMIAAVAQTSAASGQRAKAPSPSQDPLLSGFRNPPSSARPRVWWHWMNGNVTIDGIDKDIDWLSRVGVGGMQNFDANLTTPQIVQKRLVYMEPDWKQAFRHAVQRAEAKGLEFAIAASPGWSETGGPWVKPEEGMKKLVWSETAIPGGKRFSGPLAPLPAVTGPYQDVGFSDPLGPAGSKPVPTAAGMIATLAVPLTFPPLPRPAASSGDGSPLDAQALTDGRMQTEVHVPAENGAPAVVVYTYPGPVTVRSAALFVHDAQPPFAPPRYSAVLEAEHEGSWSKVTDLPVGTAAGTMSFTPATASRFRLTISTAPEPPANALGGVPGAVIEPFLPQPRHPYVRVGDFQLFSEPRVSHSEAKAGFGTVPNYYEIAGKLNDSAPSPAQVIDLSGQVRPDGTLDWTPPRGTSWKIIRLGWSLTGKTNHPATPEATGLEVDKYDAAAVADYAQHYLSMYEATVGRDLIGSKGIRALLTDSIEVGPSNWTPRLLAEFKARRGYDALPWLPALAGTLIGSTRQSDQFLYDFRRTLAELMSEAHYGTVARIAHEHGLKVYGEALEDGRPVLGDDLAMRRYTDVPMSALWTYDRKRGPRTGLLGDIKGASSVAHFYGQNLVAAESMTSAFSPWAFAPADLKPVIDLEFATGVNRPVIHTSVHQPVNDKIPGLSLAIFGQYFNRHESWAELARPWIDYIARSAYLLQQGRDVADVALFYGEETPVTAWYNQGVPGGLPTGRGFDFINADMLAALKVEGGELVSPGGARYRVIALGGTSRMMTVPVLRRLKALAEQGATIIGQRPQASPSLADNADEFASLVQQVWSSPKVIASSDADASLRSLGILPDWQIAGGDPRADLRLIHRRTGDADIYFVSNRADRPVQVDIAFRVIGKAPETWNAISGKSAPVSYRIQGQQTIVPLNLAADGSAFIIFRRPAAQSARVVPSPAMRELGTISAPWKVSFEPGRGAPASVAMPALHPLETDKDPGVRYFSGIATYSTQIIRPRSTRPGEQIWLDLGKLGDLAEVRINGRSAGIVWLSPYQVEIGSLLRPGKNRLEVRVANLWVNRLIGDQQPGARKITWTAVPTYRPDAPLRPSGLIGPVRLIGRPN